MLCTLWKQRSFCWFKVRQVPSILISSWLVQKVPPRFKLVYYSYIRLHSLQFPQTYTCADFPSFAAASPWDMSLPPQHPPHLGPVSTPKISRSRISWGWQNVLSSPHCFTPLSGMPLNSILHISLRKKIRWFCLVSFYTIWFFFRPFPHLFFPIQFWLCGFFPQHEAWAFSCKCFLSPLNSRSFLPRHRVFFSAVTLHTFSLPL